MVRTLRPDAVSVAVLDQDGSRYEARQLHGGGIYEARLPQQPGDYRIEVAYADGQGGTNTYTVDDPYRWMPTVGELDEHLIREGRHERLWEVLGAHVRRYETPRGTVEGVSFAVWAPNARGVKVTGDFDYWQARAYPMRSLGSSGVWEIFIPGVQVGSRYRYHVLGADGTWREKSDPLAFATEVPPLNASVVTESRLRVGRRRLAGRAGHRRLARAADERLRGARRLVAAGAVLPPAGRRARRLRRRRRLHPHRVHAAGRAPLRRLLGLPGHLVLRADRRGSAPPTTSATSSTGPTRPASASSSTGCPAHFPKDDWALARFDGTPLYEHADPRRGEQLDWGTYVFDFGRSEVRNFLVANALYWCQGVPHRRHPRRRGGLDALPRLLARATGCPTSTAAGRTSRRWRSCRR